MENITLTIVLAVILVVVAVLFLGISYLITGKSSLKPGACGRAPNKNLKKDDACGTESTCDLCKKNDEKK